MPLLCTYGILATFLKVRRKVTFTVCPILLLVFTFQNWDYQKLINTQKTGDFRNKKQGAKINKIYLSKKEIIWPSTFSFHQFILEVVKTFLVSLHSFNQILANLLTIWPSTSNVFECYNMFSYDSPISWITHKPPKYVAIASPASQHLF